MLIKLLSANIVLVPADRPLRSQPSFDRYSDSCRMMRD
jgi:hypothetical protein